MFKLTMFCLLLVLALGLAVAQAPSQTPSQPGQTAPPSNTTPAPATPGTTSAPAGDVKVAQEFVQLMNMQSTFEQGKEAMIKAQVQSNPALAQYEDLMREFIDKYLNWSQVEGQFVNIYADIFTEPELRELIQLYQTPTGKKLLTSMPDIMNRSMQITQKQLQPHLPELQQQIMARVQEKQKQQQGQPGQGQPGQGQPGRSGQPGQPGQPAQPGQPGQGQTQPQTPGQTPGQSQPPSQSQPGQQQQQPQQEQQPQTPPQ